MVMTTDVPDEINVHKQIWGRDADRVIYGALEGKKEGDNNVDLCPICNSRIEFGYCACGGNLGIS
jgi:hypothetical protein